MMDIDIYIMGMDLANERLRYNAKSSLIGWARA